MTKKNKARPRIIWAVNACREREERTPSAAVRPVRALARRLGADVEPVFVLSLGRGGMTYGPPLAQPRLRRAEDDLRRFLKTAGGRSMLAARIVTTLGGSNGDRARALARHASSEKAAMVVVASHARKSVERLFMGSFAESLMLRTSAPLLVVNPRTKAGAAFKRVLFPTDFGAASARAFRATLELAARLGAEVEVLHVLERPLLAEDVYLVEPDSGFPAESGRARAAAVKRARALVDAARRAGVRATASVRTAPDDSVSEAIVGAAERSGAQMIAMAAQSRAWRAAVAGSVARQVVRRAACPVLILRGAGGGP